MFHDQEVDLYIGDTFAHFETIHKNIEKCGIMQDAYIIRNVSCNSKKETIKNFLLRSALERMLADKQYNEMFVFNNNVFLNTIAFNACCKNNPELVLNFIEDAPALIDWSIRSDNSQRVEWLLQALWYRLPYSCVDSFYLSAPDYCSIAHESIKKRPLPMFDKQDTSLIATLNQIFEYKNDNLLEQADIIYFQDHFFADGLLSQEVEDEIIQSIRDIYPEKRLALKLHPRTKASKYTKLDVEIVGQQSVPWELHCLNMDIGNKILVSSNSSCLFSPKLVFHQEPVLLFLFPYLNMKSDKALYTRHQMDKFYSIRDMYTNKDNVVFISNLQGMR